MSLKVVLTVMTQHTGYLSVSFKHAHRRGEVVSTGGLSSVASVPVIR
jgi:hypothetical protein